jgi:hypothetical protein
LKYGTLVFCSNSWFVLQKKMKLLEFHTLSNLKQLELIATEKSGNASLLWLTSLLKAAPVLCRLTLKVNVHTCSQHKLSNCVIWWLVDGRALWCFGLY